MRELEVRLVEGQNFAAVDLFDLRHARKVLAAFGRAFGALPPRPGRAEPSRGSSSTRRSRGWPQDGKVVSVQLSLFAEMVKGQAVDARDLEGGRRAAGGRGRVPRGDVRRPDGAAAEHRCHQRGGRGPS